MIPTASQLQALRTHPHNTRLYLSIYQPSTVLAARVNDGSITKGARSITYDGVSSGSYLLIRSGMTLYVGSSAGAFDKGMVRVRSATSSVLTIAENSHISWADNDYLTVVSFFEINAVYPRIIQDPGDETNTLWYKDYDIEYTNQNAIQGTFINMGPHYAGFAGESVTFTASGTHHVLDESLTYSWVFEGATTTGSTAHTPGSIVWNTPGHYTVRLTAVGSSGSQDTSYRHVSIYDRPGQGANPPILNWELVSLGGSREQGGHVAKIKVYETLPVSRVREGSLVVIFGESWYGGTAQSFGGNALNRGKTWFVGYVLRGSIRYDYRSSTVEFEIGSPTEIMKSAEGFAVSVQHTLDATTLPSDDIPSGWVTVEDMNIERAVYHYLRWHSTVLHCCDVEFIGTDRLLQYFDSDRTSLYDAVHSVLKSAWVGNLVADRQGKLWAERDIHIEPDLYEQTLTLSSRDWMDEISLEETRMASVSFIEVGGIAYNGTGYLALLSNAPGTAPAYRGSVQRIQGLALVDQTELNQIAGALFAQANVTYPSLDAKLVGSYAVLDIAPQVTLPVSLSATDTSRGITFTEKPFSISRIEWRYDPRAETMLPAVDLIEIAGSAGAETLLVGDTVDIPDVPPTVNQGFDTGDIELPPFTFPGFDIPTLAYGGGAPAWVPAIVANYGGSDHTSGGVAGVTAPAETASFVPFVVYVPPGYTGVTVYAVFETFNITGSLLIAEMNLHAQPVSLAGENEDDLQTAVEAYSIDPAGSDKHRRAFPVSLTWDPALGMIIKGWLEGNPFSTVAMRVLGFSFEWTL